MRHRDSVVYKAKGNKDIRHVKDTINLTLEKEELGCRDLEFSGKFKEIVLILHVCLNKLIFTS